MTQKKRAPRNRTLTLSDRELAQYSRACRALDKPAVAREITDAVILQDFFSAAAFLPKAFAGLVFFDPPYNLQKQFNARTFSKMPDEQYERYIDDWLARIAPLMKKNASIYICCDWRSSAAVYRALAKRFIVRNRITWEREKGRGALANWKNCSEDIWFATVSDDYYFDTDAVRMKRKVIAPYKDADGKPKDWTAEDGGKFRLTFPSNLWTDITIPYWSMPENTDHPTQKPEKLLAKIILASSKPGDIVFDPCGGSGTTAVTAKKLGRHFCSVEIDATFAALTGKRLARADADPSIQGYADGVFWERNTINKK